MQDLRSPLNPFEERLLSAEEVSSETVGAPGPRKVGTPLRVVDGLRRKPENPNCLVHAAGSAGVIVHSRLLPRPTCHTGLNLLWKAAYDYVMNTLP